MLRPLINLLDAVSHVDGQAQFIFVGDYVNRGPESPAVLDLLLTLSGARFCRGNHDDVFQLVVTGKCFADNAAGRDPIVAFRWFMDYGLDTTFNAYGFDWDWLRESAANPTPQRIQSLARSVPQAHVEFINRLEPVIEFDDCFIAHGKWEPLDATQSPGMLARLQGQGQMQHRLLWGRFLPQEIAMSKAWGRRGIFGHTPIHTYPDSIWQGLMRPVIGEQIVLLDTAAALGRFGRLTALCPDDADRIIQVDHFGKLLKE